MSAQAQIPTEQAPGEARRLSALTVLTNQINTCTACTAQRAPAQGQRVVGAGPLSARMVVVGEAPGAEEEAAGAPFVGPSGVILDGWLACAGMLRAEVRVMNAMACRPVERGVKPGTERNRSPLAPEAFACRRHAIAQLRLLDPWAIVLVGEKALRILSPSTKLADATAATANNYVIPSGAGFQWVPRMRDMPRPPRGIRVFSIYHPAYGMRLAGTDPPKAKVLQERTIETLQVAAAYLGAMRRSETLRAVGGGEGRLAGSSFGDDQEVDHG